MVWTSFTRPQYDRSKQRYTSDLSDREFALIAGLLPPACARGRKRSTCLRAVIDGIFYVLQNGCCWANLPKDFPPTSTVYWCFRRFDVDGIWSRMHNVLYEGCRDLEGKEPQPTIAFIDSQSVKTDFEARDGAALVFDKLTSRFPFIQKFFADAGYQGPLVANCAPRTVEIIKRTDTGFVMLPKHWVVERTFAWITLNRRLSRDVECFANTAKMLFQIIMIKLMSRRLARYVHS